MAEDSHNSDVTDDLPAIHQQLVAYLDGELDEDANRELEQRLAADRGLREEVGRLERAWDLLDQLGRAEVGETFTRTTIEMVALDAEAVKQQEEADRPVRRRRRLLIGAAGLAISAALGFTFVSARWANPNRQLLEDLPVLERLDAYQQVDHIEFLELLHQEGLFPAEADHADA